LQFHFVIEGKYKISCKEKCLVEGFNIRFCEVMLKNQGVELKERLEKSSLYFANLNF